MTLYDDCERDTVARRKAKADKVAAEAQAAEAKAKADADAAEASLASKVKTWAREVLDEELEDADDKKEKGAGNGKSA